MSTLSLLRKNSTRPPGIALFITTSVIVYQFQMRFYSTYFFTYERTDLYKSFKESIIYTMRNHHKPIPKLQTDKIIGYNVKPFQ